MNEMLNMFCESTRTHAYFMRDTQAGSASVELMYNYQSYNVLMKGRMDGRSRYECGLIYYFGVELLSV